MIRKCVSLTAADNLTRSITLAELSRLAYSNNTEVVEAIAKQSGYVRTRFVNNEDSQAYVFKSPDDVIVAFRGTEIGDPHDWKYDLAAWPIRGLGVGRVHRGFHDAADALWEPVQRIIWKRDDRALWFTGHSLGGAIATVFAIRQDAANRTKLRGLYTFGSPRVGTKAYVKQLRTLHVRWVNNNDIVPHMPPWFLGYRHCGIEHYVDRNGRLSPLVGSKLCWDHFCGGLRGLARGRLDRISDHGISTYIDVIARML